MTISIEQLEIAQQIWPGMKIEETVGYSCHATPETPMPNGVRLLVLDQSGELVDAVDAANSECLTPKLIEKLRIANIKREKYGINQHVQRQKRRHTSRRAIRWQR